MSCANWRTGRGPFPRILAGVNPERDVLLLDVDGVLVIPPDWFGVKLLREHPQEARAFFEGAFVPATRGETDLLSHVPAFLSATGRPGTPEGFVREWLEYENHPNRPMLAAVRELRSAGWRAFLATNQERNRVNHLLREVGLGEVVDGEVASCTVGHRKPDAAYYGAVAAHLGVAPERIVFWDDSAENVEAARAAGWQAHLFTGVEDFRRVMTAGG